MLSAGCLYRGLAAAGSASYHESVQSSGWEELVRYHSSLLHKLLGQRPARFAGPKCAPVTTKSVTGSGSFRTAISAARAGCRPCRCGSARHLSAGNGWLPWAGHNDGFAVARPRWHRDANGGKRLVPEGAELKAGP